MTQIKIQNINGQQTRIRSVEDLKKVDTQALLSMDPSKIDLGTKLQDCAMIARMYERGAHYTPTEAAVFAPLQRSVSNVKIMSKKMAETMTRYIQSPQVSPADQAQNLIKAAQEQGVDLSAADSSGARSTDSSSLRSVDFGSEQQPTHNDNFGDKLLKWTKDCIPCLERPDGWISMQPNLDLLGSMENALRAMIDNMNRIASMLKNFDLYGDLCALLNLFDFVCIPDLQRIIAAIMAFLSFEIPSFEGLLGLIQALIAPIFGPILTGLAGLLDQFVLLVTNPLSCVVDAMNAQLAKLRFDTPPAGNLQVQQKPLAEVAQFFDGVGQSSQNFVDDLDQFNQGLNDGLRGVAQIITNVRNKIQEQVQLLIDELKALLGEFTLGDASYSLKAASKLSMVRLVSLILAIINAKSKGTSICSGNNSPVERQEINAFFDNFLNPNGAFNLWFDGDGNLNVDEKVDLPNVENVFEFEGDKLIDPDIARSLRDTASNLGPVRVALPCRLEVSADDVGLVNRYISELNEAGI